MLTKRINVYMGMLVVTIVGAVGTLLIVRVANADTSELFGYDQYEYAELSQ